MKAEDNKNTEVRIHIPFHDTKEVCLHDHGDAGKSLDPAT